MEIIWKNTVREWRRKTLNLRKHKAKPTQTYVFSSNDKEPTEAYSVLIYNWFVVNNHFFPNKKGHLVKTGKGWGLKSTAATLRPLTPSKSRILEPVFLLGFTLN